MIRKRDGFNNQLAIIIPGHIQKELKEDHLARLLYITDVGYYPDARFHYRERPEGCEQYILIFCTGGCGWIETSGFKKKVDAGSYFIIPANLPHRYGADESDPWSIYWIHFAGYQAVLFSNPSVPIVALNTGENNRNDRRIRLFEEIYQTLSMGYGKENLEYASVCLWYFLGSFHFRSQFERIRTIQQSDVIEKSILYMHEHIRENITLLQIASHAGYSTSHFSTVFKKKTNRSPIEYFLDLKMQYACQLIDFTNMRIKEIADELKFDDQFYFSRLFKRIIGLSPTEYRQNKKG